MKQKRINGVLYDLVPVEEPETRESILKDYLGPGNLEPKTINEDVNEATKRPGSGPIRVAEERIDGYRERFKKKQLTLADFPKHPIQKILNSAQYESIEMRSIEKAASGAQDSVWFGKGLEIDF